jgi:hypothetical protein
MYNYFRQYYILRGFNDRQKSALIKAENKEEFIRLNISIDKREQKTKNLFLLGLNDAGKVCFKKEVFNEDNIRLNNNEFEQVKEFFIVSEEGKETTLEYFEKEKEEKSIMHFEKYRFDKFSNPMKENSNRSPQQAQKNNFPNKSIEKHDDKEAENRPAGNDMAGMLKSFQQASTLFSKMNNKRESSEGRKDGSKEYFDGKDEKTINPFIGTIPNSKWIKTQYQGRNGFWHYISGKIYKNGEVKYKAIGVPGEYSMTPPSWLEGFNKYYVSDLPIAKGYWVMFLDPDSGTVVDIDK